MKNLTFLPALAVLAALPAACQSISYPMEVMAPSGTASKSVVFSVPPNTNAAQEWDLTLTIHGLEYETEGSVEVNGGTMIPLDSAHVKLQGHAAAYGGIGGAFATVSMVVPLSGGALRIGSNTVTFTFNGTDGNSSGYRIIALNFVNATTGESMLGSGTQVDPGTWTAPLNDATDIAAGQSLWQSANLSLPLAGGGKVAIKAHCADCHAHDGRDLKYFNYSNNTIEIRAGFHGLTAKQGQQIASYIRTLANVTPPPNARPWNPPYQPGPGLDSLPVNDWAAGAGLSAVLATDSQMFDYFAPNGDTSSWALNGNLNQRETPITLQLMDWNHWLPRVWPGDTFDGFTSSKFVAQTYPALVARMEAGTENPGSLFYDERGVFGLDLKSTGNWTPLGPYTSSADETNAMYSVSLWRMVREWDFVQQFGLEGQNATLYAEAPPGQSPGQGEPRGWFQLDQAFYTAPFFGHFPNGAGVMNCQGIHNNAATTCQALNVQWYEVEMITNDGSHTQGGGIGMDYGYAVGSIGALSSMKDANGGQYMISTTPVDATTSYQPQAALLFFWSVKSLQQQANPNPQGNALTPKSAGYLGWNLVTSQPSYVSPDPMKYASVDLPQATTVAYTNAYLTQWLAAFSAFSPAQWISSGWVDPSYAPPAGPNPYDGIPADIFAVYLPYWHGIGVDQSLLQQYVKWLTSLYPNYNWQALIQ